MNAVMYGKCEMCKEEKSLAHQYNPFEYGDIVDTCEDCSKKIAFAVPERKDFVYANFLKYMKRVDSSEGDNIIDFIENGLQLLDEQGF